MLSAFETKRNDEPVSNFAFDFKLRPYGMVHVNYHPDKWERMQAIVERFGDHKNTRALDRFPDGSCANAPNC